MGDLKKKREKLKADRFKAIEAATRSKVDEKLIKRYTEKLDKRGIEKFKEAKETTFGSKKKLDEDEFGGSIGDLWGAEGNTSGAKVTNKHFIKWKDVSSKKKQVNVKAVILPKGGHSYNP